MQGLLERIGVENYESGMAKGETKQATEIAQNLLNAGMTPQFVSDMTGIPLAEVIAMEKAAKQN